MKIQLNTITQGNCLDLLPYVESKSVDLILCDLPYGTTSCKWDIIIPFDPLWKEYKRILKPNAVAVFTSTQPFTTLLIQSNIKNFKYCWIWDKKIPSGMTYARFQPMRQHEDIVVFSYGSSNYYPQLIKRDKPIKSGGQNRLCSELTTLDKYKIDGFNKIYEYKNPTTIISFNKVRRGTLHPTQKPIELWEYLIKTYTKEGDTVLDNCCGSGTTGVACQNTNRNFIQFELSEKYCEIAKSRLK